MDTTPASPADLRRLRELLKDPALRREAGRAVVEGPRLLREALAVRAVRTVWATSEALAGAEESLVSLMRGQRLVPRVVDDGRLRAMADVREPQGWLCEVERAAPKPPQDATLFLALDTLQDPGNLGTLLRLSWAARAVVLLGPGCADPWSPKVLRAGAGAQFHVPLLETPDLSAALRELAGRGVRLYATDPRAKADYLDADGKGSLCWVLGSEGQGLAKELGALCNEHFRIAYPGGAESLNVAISGAILLFETLRQRK